MDEAKYQFEDVFTSSQGYANRFSGNIGQWLLSVQSEAIIRALSKRANKGDNLLDFGGGHGQLIEVASALELNPMILASHIDAFANLQQRLSIEVANSQKYSGFVAALLSIPCKDKAVSVVTCVRLLSHCDDWQHLISEMCRVSSDLVIVDYPPLASSNILYKLLFPIKKILEGNTRTFKIFTHKEIEIEFLANGFSLDQRIGQFFWPMVLHRKLKSVGISKFLEKIAATFGLIYLFGNPSIAVFKRFTPFPP